MPPGDGGGGIGGGCGDEGVDHGSGCEGGDGDGGDEGGGRGEAVCATARVAETETYLCV